MHRANYKNSNVISSEEFEFRLKTCIQWSKLACVGENSVKSTFRNLDELSEITEKLMSLNFIEEIEFIIWTAGLHQIRLKALKESLISINDSSNADFEGGRILGHVRDENLEYGILEHDTDGFFDSEDYPPIGLWLAKIGNCLLSYIPASFVKMVDQALVNLPDDSVHWTDERPEFIKLLK